MRTETLAPDEPVIDTTESGAGPAGPVGGTGGGRRAAPALAMVSGLVVLAVAGAILAGTRTSPAPVVGGDPTAITLSARDISVVTQVYAPGEASGWHAHSGIHAVAVLSGVLTVYDAQCRPQTFEPGRPYVGGQDLHLVRNESDAPVVMSVTYLSPTTGAGPTRRLPAPAACPV